MPTGNGVTSDTPVSIVIGAGVMLRNHAFIGPTIDNNLFGVDREMFTPQFNGLMGDLMETDYIVRSVARIEATIPQVNGTIIESGIPGATVTPTAGQTLIEEATSRRLSAADYADWELDVDRPGGGQFQFEVDNALNTNPFESELTDDATYAPRYNLMAKIDAANPTVSPWRIRILDVAS